jgi:nucleoside-diphosphate-sugar epimerase
LGNGDFKRENIFHKPLQFKNRCINNMNTVSILGCGWLGLPIAKELVRNNFSVKGSTTSTEKIESLQKSGIEAFNIKLNPHFEGSVDFFNSENLVINIPPKAKTMGEDYHLEQVKGILMQCQDTIQLKKIVFISSTSVYPNVEQEMTEEDADGNHLLVKAENLIREFCVQSSRNFLILRLGGLMGYDRNPCKYFTEKTSEDTSRVNYIHRDDAVGALVSLLNEDIHNEIFNIVSPKHPTRAEIWANCGGKSGAILPKSREVSKKIISVEHFLDISKYQFICPDPLAFKYL